MDQKIQQQLTENQTVQLDPRDSEPQRWQDIELTTDEITKALDAVRLQKWEVIEKDRAIKLRAWAENEARRPWTAENLYEMINYWAANMGFKKLKKGVSKKDKDAYEPGLEVDKYNEDVIKALCYYFTKDKVRFEKIGKEKFQPHGENWDINKGIYLFGDVGTGKSSLFKLFAKNKRRCFDNLSSRTIADNYTKNGPEWIKNFSFIRYEPTNSIEYFFQREIGLAIDDLGTEERINVSWGNKKNVLQEIMLNRYDSVEVHNRFTHDATHVTSNLTPSQIEEFYGDRIKDRFRQQFNIVALQGPSRRR